MKAMKWILAVVTTTMIMIPPQSANAWDGGHPGGYRGDYGHGYAGDYRGDYGPRYHGRGYGYHGPRYYGRGYGYYRRPGWVIEVLTMAMVGAVGGADRRAALAGLAIGTIVGRRSSIRLHRRWWSPRRRLVRPHPLRTRVSHGQTTATIPARSNDPTMGHSNIPHDRQACGMISGGS